MTEGNQDSRGQEWTALRLRWAVEHRRKVEERFLQVDGPGQWALNHGLRLHVPELTNAGLELLEAIDREETARAEFRKLAEVSASSSGGAPSRLPAIRRRR